MKIRYDPESDALVIYLREGLAVAHTEPLEQDERFLIDDDADDRPVAFEIMQASELLGGDIRVELDLPIMSRETS